MNPVTIAIIGGDLRQLSLAEALARDGHRVRLYAQDELRSSDPAVIHCSGLSETLSCARCIIGPLPMCDEELRITAPLSRTAVFLPDLLELAAPNAVLLGGKIPEKAILLAKARGIPVFDYLLREEFAVLNAIPTAEGAIQIAMEELPITLDRARCLVVGAGRIGTLLAHKLKALGADVSVSARKCSDLAWSRAFGYTPLRTDALGAVLSEFDVIFNTVPHRIFGAQELLRCKKEVLCIDLASKPGGFNLDAAKELSRKVIWALSLPGKVAPLTAGIIIRDTVVNILQENGILHS